MSRDLKICDDGIFLEGVELCEVLDYPYCLECLRLCWQIVTDPFLWQHLVTFWRSFDQVLGEQMKEERQKTQVYCRQLYL